MMKLSDFYYNIDDALIARFPPKVRGTSNLMIIKTSEINNSEDITKICFIDKYKNLYSYIDQNWLVVLNNTKVVPARVSCRNQKNNLREVFFLEKQNEDSTILKAIIKGRVKVKDMLSPISNNEIKFQIIKKEGDIVYLENNNGSLFYDLLDKIGDVPIPPYLQRDSHEIDKKRYQTVFSKIKGSVAAPTASLNFTAELFKNLEKSNINYDFITLHCGYGTFKPILSDTIEKHEMHEEYFEIPNSLCKTLKNKSKKVLAIGTTVCRTLEYNYLNEKKIQNIGDKVFGHADIFLFPGKKFHVIDGLLTNFHAPTSTPLQLACAYFSYKLSLSSTISTEQSVKLFLQIYAHAQNNGFKFLSYGDSMLIL